MTDPATPTTPIIVLVRPQLGENIGTAARAMLNFGVTGMRLVAPRDGWPSAKAGAAAAGASEVLDGVRVFDDVAAAVADCHYVLATTARQRGLFVPVLEPEPAARDMTARMQAGHRTAILFGGEKAGLSTEDAAHAHALLTIPVNPAFSSLNLAQAVLLICYELQRVRDPDALFGSPYEAAPADQETFGQFFHHLETALDRAGYYYPDHKRAVLSQNLRTLFGNAALSASELRVLHGVLRQFERHLPGTDD